jgi:hypothetical protein
MCLPLYDEAFNVRCTARAADGDALTTSISITWLDGQTRTGSQQFPAGASSSEAGATFVLNSVNRTLAKELWGATGVCTVTNSRGQTTTQSITARYPGFDSVSRR